MRCHLESQADSFKILQKQLEISRRFPNLHRQEILRKTEVVYRIPNKTALNYWINTIHYRRLNQFLFAKVACTEKFLKTNDVVLSNMALEAL